MIIVLIVKIVVKGYRGTGKTTLIRALQGDFSLVPNYEATSKSVLTKATWELPNTSVHHDASGFVCVCEMKEDLLCDQEMMNRWNM